MQAQLQWPTGLALSALDGSLHFIDDRLVLKLTSDLKVRLVAGTPLHCHSSADQKSDEDKQVIDYLSCLIIKKLYLVFLVLTRKWVRIELTNLKLLFN